MRYYSKVNKGKQGECLYPGQDRPDFSFDIDCLVELSEDFIKTSTMSLIEKNFDEKFDGFIERDWPEFLEKIEK